MLKLRLVAPALVLFVVPVAMGLLVSATARAQTTDECGQDPTIASLVACVEHCVANGFINNQGVASSLLAELNAAQGGTR